MIVFSLKMGIIKNNSRKKEKLPTLYTLMVQVVDILCACLCIRVPCPTCFLHLSYTGQIYEHSLYTIIINQRNDYQITFFVALQSD